MNRHERRAAGRGSKGRANVAGLSAAASLYESGMVHMRAGRSLDAQVCCQQALAIDPNHPASLHLMGLLSVQAEQYDLAMEWISRAIDREPRPEYFLGLATTLKQLSRHEDALRAFDKAIELKPDIPSLWVRRGHTLSDLQRPADALLSYQRALDLDPHHWDAAYQSGFLLHEARRLEEAISYLNRCDALRPNHSLTLQMRAISLHYLRRFEEALVDARRAQALEPTEAGLCNIVGKILQSCGREEEALEWFDRTLELRSNFRDALHNKAASLTKIRRLDEAFAIYDRLIVADPNDALADVGIAHLHLLTGNFEAGWAGREARWKKDASISRTYPEIQLPMWLGDEALEGKTILIGADEGLGDTIQFARYVPFLAGRGARVVLLVQDHLCSLLSDLPGVSQCVPMSSMETDSLPAFDLHCPIMSLPLALGTRLDTVPAPTSYLPPAARDRAWAWEDRLGPHERLRVGLVWSGNPEHQNDHHRSLPLRTLARILDVDATFVSLQKDPRPADKATLHERADIVDLTTCLSDFTETAALMTCLDLVITVDTSVAHLAGALGRPTWILLPYVPDYRWLLDRDDSPWYPTMRLFRQSETRDYTTVLDRVRAELLTRVSSFRPETN
jgi:tetratricopeptide (TPR) repeat protein